MKTRLSLCLMLVGLVGLSACDSSPTMGIRTLGLDFLRMFNMDRNKEPLDAQDVQMTLTPAVEPFNP
jgi:hypothetical protein